MIKSIKKFVYLCKKNDLQNQFAYKKNKLYYNPINSEL